MTRPSNETSNASTIRAGFIPLADAAPLIVASRLGFAEAENLHIELLRETSWATVRDRLAVCHLDAAHMLGPMPIADSLGLTPLPVGLVVPMSLGLAGNTVTVSRKFVDELSSHGGGSTLDAATGARAFSGLVAARRKSGRPGPTLAIVHPYSAHHYQLAYWLGWAGVRPGVDVELVVVPPSLMTAALGSARIDGFCVGEPWGSAAVAEGVGHILTTSAHIWRQSPDKVLGVRRAFAQDDPRRLEALVRAVYKAACWCDDPANHDDLARLMSAPDLIGQPAPVILAGLSRRAAVGGNPEAAEPGFLRFASDDATFPWISHAAWFYAQMLRWGQAPRDRTAIEAACSVYRPDLFRSALMPIGVAVPDTGSRTEGATGANAFFDATVFDPSNIADYVGSFPIRAY